MPQKARPHQKKAIVIGTGIGGAGIAAQLAQARFDVTVFERNAFSGGKTSSYTRDGFNMDIAIHVSPRCEIGPIAELARRVHVDITFLRREPILRMILGDRACSVPMKFYLPLPLLKSELAYRFSPLIVPGVLRFAWKVMCIRTPEDVKLYEGMTAAELIKQHVKDPRFYGLMDALASLMMVLPTQEASAADFLWCLSNWLKNANTGYPQGGYGVIPHRCLDVCRKHGGVVRLNEAVDRITVDNGRITGVETKQGFYPADIVVSNAGFKQTVHLAGPENFNPAFADRANALKDSQGGVVVQYTLNYQPTRELVTLYIPDGYKTDTFIASVERGHDIEPPHLYIVSPTAVDPSLAPKGKHILLAGTIVPPALSNKAATEVVLDMIEETMQRLFPGLEKNTIWKVRRNIDFFAALGGRGAAESIGLGQRFDQDGRNKPQARLPIQGLYVVGADAGGTGIGTELAADSALNVFDMIMDDVCPISC